eukprot:TRINITY_DN52458_c0_g1_i1.p1 TRINITY_DN52458_c0_g1~~TRINITY_DN52458_c0_g1_i1.p1  ORF type:complete len:160 (-),score=34.32 TRINITY_DN52458_c0_g1_i1:102-581(-)
MIRRPPRSTLSSSSAASDVYKRQQCGQCTAQFKQFSADVGGLQTPDTAAVVNQKSFNPLAECVQQAGRQLGVEIAETLNAVEAHGMQQGVQAWTQATNGIDPARHQIQRAFAPNGTAPDVQQMSIEEFRGCQIWMYGLATRLQACQGCLLYTSPSPRDS